MFLTVAHEDEDMGDIYQFSLRPRVETKLATNFALRYCSVEQSSMSQNETFQSKVSIDVVLTNES